MATANGANGTQKSALVPVDEFVGRDYDYLICGGGTAGLAVAARLTENPDVTVGVIEAGKSRLGDPLVDIPAMFTQMLGNKEYDWAWETIPQPGNKNKVHQVARGKALGGSSAINYMMYVRGSDQDYDDWAELANDPSWSSANMKQYMRKHQTLEPVDERIADRSTMPFVGENHGTSGPVRTGFNDFRLPLEDDVIKAADHATGFDKKPIDPWSGDHIGFYNTLGAVVRTGPDKGKRSYAARGYFQPNEHRPNLKVITETVVARVVLENKKATGVEFIHNGQKHTVKAKREVIVCGGTINSPQILEMSGIGNPEILRAAGVECLVDLPSVGENYQDHAATAAVYQLADGQMSADSIYKPEVMAAAQKALVEEQGGPLTAIQSVQGFFPCTMFLEDGELDQTIKSIESAKAKTPFQRKQWDQVISHLKSNKSANLQLVFIAATGNLHEGPGDQSKLPPQLPGQEADVAVLAAGLKFVEKTASSPSLKDKLSHRIGPEPDKFPLDSVQSRRAAVREHVLGEYHSCGSCAMGDTVDSRLRVKGVQNLRVADASVFPNNVSGNILSSVYMIAEKAADMIKEDWDYAALNKFSK
ncbi:hypothetical protein CLAIMM_04571 [Cladophialophora immunda]|nr:hypothetical protein CLAIMM_04571 [Cladophialophora immunda]